MLIDWFTVSAQILNFLVLLYLLKHFLYKPIFDAIDAREKKIADTIADADTKKIQAENERFNFEQKNQQFEQQRQSQLDKVNHDARRQQKELLQAARLSAEKTRQEKLAALYRELQNIHQDIAQKSLQQVFSISQLALKDLASIELQQHIFIVFIQRLDNAFINRTGGNEADENKALTLEKMLNKPQAKFIVRCSFELTADQQNQIRSILQQWRKDETAVELRFEIAEQLICGIEITANGWRLAWNSQNYLDLLQKSCAELPTLVFSESTVKPTQESAKHDNLKLQNDNK